MAFSSTITITGSTNITNFDIFQCPTSGCTGCVAITGSTGENVSRMKLLTGHTVSVDQGYRYIKLVADTATCNNSICMEVTGIPTFTPTPIPTSTPTPTPTATNIPNSTSTPTPTPTPTTAPNCVVDIEYATVASTQKLYWNFATIGVNNYPTVMRFRIQKNGSDYINTTGSTQNSTQYIEPLQNWMGNTSVSPGDAIIFTVTTVTSGSSGSTIGNMGTYTTTGTSGYMPNVSGTPVAPNAITLNSQSVDPDGGAVTYSFTVTSGVNYALNCTYFQ
jgi:hypothetical protein